jgi:ParB-like chromosome segregation protein Spo0J
MPEIETVPLSRLRTDGGTQMRDHLVEEAIEDYADLYRAGAELPPLGVVYEDKKGRDSDVWLYDGFHRLEGARRAGLTELPCVVTHGTLRDARLLAAGANARHGLRRDNPTKRRAICTALAESPSWSDRRVAEHCLVGLPHGGSLMR